MWQHPQTLQYRTSFFKQRSDLSTPGVEKGQKRKALKKSPLNLMSQIVHYSPLKCHLEMSTAQQTNMVKSLNITTILHKLIFILKLTSAI